MKNWVFIFLILAACDFAAYHDPAGQGENVDLGTPCADGGMEATLFFADIRAQILEPKCLSCHSAAGGNRGGVNLESFENTKAQLTRVKFTIENGLMPKAPVPPLSQDQKNIFASWLNQGAPKDQQSLQNCSAGSNGGGETPPVTDELNKMPSVRPSSR